MHLLAVKIRVTLFFVFLFQFSFSQTEIITGTITDNQGVPLPGVNILEDAKTYNGAVTDFDGNFIIKASSSAKLIISYVGFITQEIQLNGQTNLAIIMEEDLFGLDEVTVVAYGEQKKQTVIGQSKRTCRGQ